MKNNHCTNNLLNQTMKISLTILFIACSTAFRLTASTPTYQLSSHILDIDKGSPAANVLISLSKQTDNQWILIDEKTTDANGRIKDFLPENGRDHKGIYKLTYHTAPYFAAQGKESFYPFIEVVFEIKDDQHYHVPITLSAYGYSTYRGN